MTRLETGMVCKTKAHRTYEEAVANQDQDNWVGNDWADHYAKKAAQEHRARDVVIGNWKGIIDRTKRAAWAMIVILEKWPKTHEAVTDEIWTLAEKVKGIKNPNR